MHVLVHVVKYISNCTLDETFINLENRLKEEYNSDTDLK